MLLKHWNAYGLGVKLKQSIGFYQIGTKIEQAYRVSMPAEVRTLLNRFAVVITLGLDITTPLECFGAHRYEQRLHFWLVLPIVLVLAIFGVGLLKARFQPKRALAWALPPVFKLMVRVHGSPIVFALSPAALPAALL